jgi:hypothetical protein
MVQGRFKFLLKINSTKSRNYGGELFKYSHYFIIGMAKLDAEDMQAIISTLKKSIGGNNKNADSQTEPKKEYNSEDLWDIESSEPNGFVDFSADPIHIVAFNKPLKEHKVHSFQTEFGSTPNIVVYEDGNPTYLNINSKRLRVALKKVLGGKKKGAFPIEVEIKRKGYKFNTEYEVKEL